MEMDLFTALRAGGVNVDDALRRFSGNVSLYEKYVLRFPAEPTMPALRDAVNRGDAAKAVVAAHTLKGLAGNMSFTAIYESAAAMNRLLRDGSDTQAYAMMPEIERQYQAVVQIINRYL